MSQFIRHLFPSTLLAGLAVALFCIAPFSANDTGAGALLFEAQFSSAPADARLAWDQGAGFAAENAPRLTPARGSSTLSRALVPAGTYRAFRLAGAAGLEITDARIVDLDGRELAHFGPDARRPVGTGVEINCVPPLVLRSSLATSPAP